jgi:lipopolysaccharide transport system ATP-binding protein
VWLDEGEVKMIGPAKQVCESYNAFIHQLATGQFNPTIRRIPVQERANGQVSTGAGGHDMAVDPSSKTGGKPLSRPDLPNPPPGSPSVFETLDTSESFGTGMAEIVTGKLLSQHGGELFHIAGGEAVQLNITARAKADLESAILGFIVKDRLGQPIFGDNTLQRTQGTFEVKKDAVVTASFAFRLPLLAAGRYSVTLALATGSLENHVHHHWLHDALLFDVHSGIGGVTFALPAADSNVIVDIGRPPSSLEHPLVLPTVSER